MSSTVYMDYHATTPVDDRVIEAMLPYFREKFGNPASRQHRIGWIADEAVENSRKVIAQGIGSEAREIVFTSGATESNNLALKGVAEAWSKKGNHIVTARTEHKSVLDVCKRLEKRGVRVTYVEVDETGKISLDALRSAITPGTILVSIMTANNEIGTIQPIKEIGSLCREYGVLFHTDVTQALGKVPFDVDEMNVDLASFSGHKIYGPKGVGALYVRSSQPRVALAAQTDGGGHERGMRSGTLNVPGIVGLSVAVKISLENMESEGARLAGMRDQMLRDFSRQLENVHLNGHPTDRLPGNLNVSFEGVEDSILMMSMKDVAVSTGSACSTSDPEPSHVLKALHLPAPRLHSSIRFGLGRFTTGEEVDYVIRRVVEVVNQIRKGSPTLRKETTAIPS